ncbi:MAG: tRNA pseudouridine(55) synthase TruB [Deltaproteobacteria bacterium]|nr:tRNA pseudouridine(55) synthase TruB [Deltaproteobacteria bacterium]
MAAVVVIDKPAGMTSHDVVQFVRRRLNLAKAGHTGTLDPMATGVLPVCLGEATKIAGLLSGEDKRYRAHATLGLETDTGDATGRELARGSLSGIDFARIEQVARDFVGTIEQRPPAYSAIRVDGKRAYERARAGEVVELPVRQVTISALSVEMLAGDHLLLDVTCSKGTYVRSLIADIGRALGCLATMSGLCRLRSGALSLEQAVQLDQLDDDSPMLSMDSALAHLPAADVEREAARRIQLGQPLAFVLSAGAANPETLWRVRCDDRLIALASYNEGCLRPKRVFLASAAAPSAD